MKSALEKKFAYGLKLLGNDLPAMEREYRFHPARKFRADFAFVNERLLVEIDGGQWSPGGGRHNTTADLEKRNLAMLAGWRVLHFNGDMVTNHIFECIQQVRAALTDPTDPRD